MCAHAGAETGAGGRMRDTHATGVGSIMGAGTAGYCVGNLGMEGCPLPGEDASFAYPDSLAPPLQVRALPCGCSAVCGHALQALCYPQIAHMIVYHELMSGRKRHAYVPVSQ
jgi:hypothetical protein